MEIGGGENSIPVENSITRSIDGMLVLYRKLCQWYGLRENNHNPKRQRGINT